ncbi:hypothetical protein T06_6475, partial [Trichinella sp. T6]
RIDSEMAANEQFICSDKQLLSRVFVSYLNSLVLLDPSRRTVVQISDERLDNRFGCAIAWSVKYPHRLRAYRKPFLYPVCTKTTEVD